MEEARLREGLSKVDKEELVEELVRLYLTYAPLEKDIEEFLRQAPAREVKWRNLQFLFQKMGNGVTPLQCRQALLDYIKDCGSTRKEARAYFAFAEGALDAREEGLLEAGILRPAASAFGKGLEKISKDIDGWNALEADTLRLAKRFYAYNEEEAWKALRYYQEAKRAIQKKMDRKHLS